MWGQNWGLMIWGRASASVPALSGVALLLMSVLLLVIGYRLGKRQRAPRWLPWLTGIGAALLPAAVVRATTFTVPFVFTNGTVADATQVNSNMSTIATEIDRLRKPVAISTECEFRARQASAGYECGLGQGGADITDGSNTFGLAGPVHVPQGATITSVDIFVNDTSSTADVQLCLRAAFDTFGSYDTAFCATTSGTPGITKLTITTSSIQGMGEAFELFALARDASTAAIVSWPTMAALTVRTAYVHYEIP